MAGGDGTDVGDGLVAASGQRSAVAEGAEGNAYAPTVGDQVRVGSVDPIAIAAQCGGQEILGVASSGCRQDETEAAGDARDVLVDQRAGATKGEKPDARRGLGSRLGELSEPPLGFRQGHRRQAAEVEFAALGEDGAEDAPDTLRLEIR